MPRLRGEVRRLVQWHGELAGRIQAWEDGRAELRLGILAHKGRRTRRGTFVPFDPAAWGPVYDRVVFLGRVHLGFPGDVTCEMRSALEEALGSELDRVGGGFDPALVYFDVRPPAHPYALERRSGSARWGVDPSSTGMTAEDADALVSFERFRALLFADVRAALLPHRHRRSAARALALMAETDLQCARGMAHVPRAPLFP